MIWKRLLWRSTLLTTLSILVLLSTQRWTLASLPADATTIITTFAGGGPTLRASGTASDWVIGRPQSLIADGAGSFYAASAVELFHVQNGSIIDIPELGGNFSDIALDG